MARRLIQSNKAGSRWAVRIVPLFIIGLLGLATYVVVARLCLEYLYREKKQSGVAVTLITLYLVFLVLTIIPYIRTYYTVQYDPALVPLSSARAHIERETDKKTRGKWNGCGRDVEEPAWAPPDFSPDSPGLEAFYSKEIFVCEVDGRPKWCSQCQYWKPDRAHHSSELGRCVRKMDHFCPWVGGMVSETSFNFFSQFTFYCTLLSAVSLATGAYCLSQQRQDGQSMDGWTIAIIVLASFFGFFSFGMTLTSARYIFTNITNIDVLKKTQNYTLAVRIPLTSPPSEKYPTITYPLRYNLQRPQYPDSGLGEQRPASASLSLRDQQAKCKFAILRTGPRDNPWDLGFWENWKSVMGGSILEWILPIRRSPCCNHESMESDYQYGPLLRRLKKEYGVPELAASGDGADIEMHNTSGRFS